MHQMPLNTRTSEPDILTRILQGQVRKLSQSGTSVTESLGGLEHAVSKSQLTFEQACCLLDVICSEPTDEAFGSHFSDSTPADPVAASAHLTGAIRALSVCKLAFSACLREGAEQQGEAAGRAQDNMPQLPDALPSAVVRALSYATHNAVTVPFATEASNRLATGLIAVLSAAICG
jgi:hypothetical protein